MRHYNPTRLAGVLALAAGITIPATAADITYTANPPRVQAKLNSVSPMLVIPKCTTSDTTVPTYPLIYCYRPIDIWTAYDVIPTFIGGNFGQGQTIVIIDAFGSPTIQQDLQAFHDFLIAPHGFPNPDFQVICPMGCPHFNANNKPQDEVGWSFETSLDVQWAHAMAPLAKIRLIVAPDSHGESIHNAIRYAIANFPGSIISQSFGSPEAGLHANNGEINQAHALFQAAAGQGITVLASTGDSGASNGANFPNASYPASDPYVTAVGGTQGLPLGNLVKLSCTSTLCTPTGYGAEQVWNEPWQAIAGGGAQSLIFAPPAYQTGLGLTGRGVPDVAFNAAVDGGVLVAYSAQGPALAGFYISGGTSAAVQQWGGIMALANAARAFGSKGPLGFVNPALYSIAKGPNYSLDFHDITMGNNMLFGSVIGYSAGTGYDLATGWGSPDVSNLVTDLAALP